MFCMLLIDTGLAVYGDSFLDLGIMVGYRPGSGMSGIVVLPAAVVKLYYFPV